MSSQGIEAQIADQRTQLQIHRKALQAHLERRALLGTANSPPEVVQGIAEARQNIARIKQRLSVWGVAIEDLPDDRQLDDASSISAIDLRTLREQALELYYADRWVEVEPLLGRLLGYGVDDSEIRAAWSQTRARLDVQKRYEMLHKFREEGNWRAVIRALDAPGPERPMSLDESGLRSWAEQQRRRSRLAPARALYNERGADAAIDWVELELQRSPVDRDLLQLLMGVLADAQAMPQHRLRAGNLLGQFVDPRLPVDLEAWQRSLEARGQTFGAPGAYWCYVRGGSYQVGPAEAGTSAQLCTLPTYWIARYPLTTAQYLRFLEAGAYTRSEWWSSSGLRWRLSRNGRTALAQPGTNRPITALNWFEASAFCAWLSAQLEGLPAGYTLRLPTEAEWEVAAAYDATARRRTYPWGDTPPAPARAIYEASSLDAPAPVGCAPAGAAACGALDMVGNVWEIMQTPWTAYPQQQMSLRVIEPGDHIALRGGSWRDDETAMLCRSRTRQRADTSTMQYGGMRLVLARILPGVSQS